ncbi:MAG: HAD family hydrolase [Candidatus Ozemobacteraceae bacterium]
MPSSNVEFSSKPSHGRPYTAVFLDVGGTLIFPDPERMSKLFFDISGIAFPTETWLETIYKTTIDLDDAIKTEGSISTRWWSSYFERLLNYLPLENKKNALKQSVVESFCDLLFKMHHAQNLWSFHADGADNLLKTLLNMKYRLGIISNSDGRVHAQIKEAGWSDRFEFIIDSHIVEMEKPDPAIFRLGLEKARLTPAEVLYVGDFVNIDKRGANAADMDCVIIDPLHRRPELGEWRIDRLPDLIPWLKRREKPTLLHSGKIEHAPH